MPFYQNQIAAGNEIISLFTDGDRGYRWDRGLDSNEIIDRTIQLQLQKSFWNVLAAEMQSGKTNTYLWVAFEMLRIGEIYNIYIICGSSSKKLKEQLQNDYDDALDDYIDEMERIGINIDTRRIIKNKIKNTKKIYFSNDLSKIPELPNNTLLIWDESHYAQDVKNRPNILLNKLGIEATGKIEYLKNKNIKILSVSATGFSEISDNYHFEQSKKIVRLKNGERYIGVKKFWENGNIILFKDPLEKLNEILENHLREKRYAIVRCSNKNYTDIKQLFELYNWNVKTFNSKTNDIDSLEYLKDRPDKNTVVLINGMCRMGEKLCKEHISFVMETTKSPKTDTILQSLLGRMSGYDSNIYIQIYISENVIMTKENQENDIVKYIKFCDGENICPGKAKNLVDSSKKWKPNIICKISSDNRSTGNRINVLEYVSESIFERKLDDPNNEEYKIDEKIIDIIENKPDDVLIRNITGRDEDGALSKTYKNVPFQIMKSYNERSPALLTDAGCTFISNDREMINIWVFKTNEFADIGIKENDIFIDTRVLNSDNIPRTTGIECFSHRHKLINEDQTITEMNGRQPSDLPIETSTDEELMKNELSVRIKVSLEYSSQFSRKIESAKSDDNKWIGIIVTPEIYDSIKKGEIYKHMLREYKVKLNPIKSKGRQPIYEDGKIRLIKIEW
jgi:hypothetical protein